MRRHEVPQGVVVRVTKIVAVDVGKLVEIETSRRFADTAEIKQRYGIRAADDFLVSVAPAKPKQVVHHRFGKKTHLAIGIDTERAVPLRQLGAIGPVDQRNMREDRYVPSHAAIDHRLSESIVQMVVAADDMRHLHVMVVDDDGKHVGRGAVGTENDHIVEILVADGDCALDRILDCRLAFIRHPHADNEGCVGGVGAPAPGRADRLAGGAGVVTKPFQFGIRQEAAIGRAGLDKGCRDLGMAGGARRLAHRRFVAFKAKP